LDYDGVALTRWMGFKLEKEDTNSENRPRNPPKSGPKIRVLGAPGRGVLRFFGRGIQQARSFFGKKHVFYEKCADLGVDVI